MSAATPKQPAPATKPKEVKTDHIRKGITVLGVFIAAVAVVVVIHGIVAPRHTKGPGGGGIIASAGAKPQQTQAGGETPANLAKEIGAYRQAAAAAAGVVVDQAAVASAGGGAPLAVSTTVGGSTGGAPQTVAQQRMDQEEAEYIRQALREPMQLYTAGSGVGGAPAPAPAQSQPNPLSGGDIQDRYKRLNEQLADLARRQHAGQNQ